MVIIQTFNLVSQTNTFYLTHSIPDSREFSFERSEKVFSEKKSFLHGN